MEHLSDGIADPQRAQVTVDRLRAREQQEQMMHELATRIDSSARPYLTAAGVDGEGHAQAHNADSSSNQTNQNY